MMMVGGNKNDPCKMLRSTHREPLTAEDAYVYNVGTRRSITAMTTKTIHDVRPSKLQLPVTSATPLQQDAPVVPLVQEESPPRKLPLTDADAKVPNVERRLPKMTNLIQSGEPGGDPLLDASLR